PREPAPPRAAIRGGGWGGRRTCGCANTARDVIATLVTRADERRGRAGRATRRYRAGVASDEVTVTAAGREVRITSPGKVFFPRRGETKLDLVRYYLAVEEPIMRAMQGRPSFMQRFPDALGGAYRLIGW